jgi:hypothetical protein
MFTPINATAITKNGASRTRFRRMEAVSPIFADHTVHGPRAIGSLPADSCHHTIPNSSTGKTETDPLPSIANTKADKLSQ